MGLQLDFAVCSDGAVETVFPLGTPCEGYQGVLHGGIVASLLDGAMTNCLFAHGIAALTGQMTVRYQHPVRIDKPVTVRGELLESLWEFHKVEAKLVQTGKQVAIVTITVLRSPNVTDQ